LTERPSHRGLISAESAGRGSSSSSAFEYRRSSTSGSAANRSPSSVLNSKLATPLQKKSIPPPPFDASKRVPLPLRDSSRVGERDASVGSRAKVRDVSVDSRATKGDDGPTPRKRLSGKIPPVDPAGISPRREKSVGRSSRHEGHNSSLSSLNKSESRSRGRSVSGKGNSSGRSDRSSSRHSQATTVTCRNGSNKSVGPRSSIISRRHSAEITSSKSVCNMKFHRHDSAPEPTTSVLKKGNYGNETSKPMGSMKRMNSKQSTTSATTASVTSSEEDHQAQGRGRSLFSPAHSRCRSKSKSKNRNDTSCERSLFSRGRSKSKSRLNIEDNSIFSAGRSFANSLTRRRSLSRGATKVLKTTSTMDGNQDSEPCMQRYEVPFNPSTGRCNYHPEITLAVKNGGVRGGWRIVSQGCPKCHG
jgi:hypothetical protein